MFAVRVHLSIVVFMLTLTFEVLKGSILTSEVILSDIVYFIIKMVNWKYIFLELNIISLVKDGLDLD